MPVITIREMSKILIDKGYDPHYADTNALVDRDDFLREHYSAAEGTEECSVCRRSFTQL